MRLSLGLAFINTATNPPIPQKGKVKYPKCNVDQKERSNIYESIIYVEPKSMLHPIPTPKDNHIFYKIKSSK